MSSLPAARIAHKAPRKFLGRCTAETAQIRCRHAQPPAAAGVEARFSAVLIRTDHFGQHARSLPPSHAKRGGMPVWANLPRASFFGASRLSPPAGASGAPMSSLQLAEMSRSSAGGPRPLRRSRAIPGSSSSGKRTAELHRSFFKHSRPPPGSGGGVQRWSLGLHDLQRSAVGCTPPAASPARKVGCCGGNPLCAIFLGASLLPPAAGDPGAPMFPCYLAERKRSSAGGISVSGSARVLWQHPA